MYHLELTFTYSDKLKESVVAQTLYSLIGSWTNNGQILNTDYPIVFHRGYCQAIVACPERTSFRSKYANKWVHQSLLQLKELGVSKPTIRLFGREIESPMADKCKQPSWFILMTSYTSSESPLICGEHYLHVPLYRVPPTYEPDPSYWDILGWQKQWKSCDQLQMSCSVGERWATKQISDLDSALCIIGRELCSKIEKLSGIPTYYYLYRGNGRSTISEQKRTCPSCGGKWFLDESLHNTIDFKCDRCRLVSNIAWSVRK